MISRSTIAAAARVIEYAAARPIVLSAVLMPPSKPDARGDEDVASAAHPQGREDSHCIADALALVEADVGASGMPRPSARSLKNT
jgi:hypothetical protein